jgi:hypothetical protein
VKNLRKQLDQIKVNKDDLVMLAQDNVACGMLAKHNEIMQLKKKFESMQINNYTGSLSIDIDSKLHEAGELAGDAAYKKMEAKRPLGCRFGDESGVVVDFNTIMGMYGPAYEGRTYDPKVIREAYLRAVKPELRTLTSLRARNPEDKLVNEKLGKKIIEAQDTWHFTYAELGIQR